MLPIQLKNTQSPLQVYEIDPYSDGRTKFSAEVLSKGYLNAHSSYCQSCCSLADTKNKSLYLEHNCNSNVSR